MASPANLISRIFVALWVLAVAFPSSASAGDLARAEQTFNSELAELPKPTLVLGGWTGSDSDITEFSVERVTDSTAWSQLWARHSPDAVPPSLDFAKVMVIAMFASVPTYFSRMELVDVKETDRIDITTKFFIYDNLTQDRANYYLIVVLNRSTKPIRVVGRSFALNRSPQEREDLWKEFGALDAANGR
jgi:hypothetical protein